MITMMKVTEIEAKNAVDGISAGFDVLFNVEDVKIEKNEVRLKFAYAAEYKGNAGSAESQATKGNANAGHIMIKGEIKDSIT